MLVTEGAAPLVNGIGKVNCTCANAAEQDTSAISIAAAAFILRNISFSVRKTYIRGCSDQSSYGKNERQLVMLHRRLCGNTRGNTVRAKRSATPIKQTERLGAGGCGRSASSTASCSVYTWRVKAGGCYAFSQALASHCNHPLLRPCLRQGQEKNNSSRGCSQSQDGLGGHRSIRRY